MDLNRNNMRKFIFNLLFTEYERRTIINALFERSFEDSVQQNQEMNKETRSKCMDLARELS